MKFQRLTSISPLIALLAAVFLLFLAVSTVIFGTRYYTAQIRSNSEVQAKILASTASAALAFDDTRAGREYVNAMAANPDILAAGLYRPDGTLFVGFARDREAAGALRQREPSQDEPSDRIEVSAPIVQGAHRLGSVRLVVLMGPLAERLLRLGLIAALVLMTAVVLAGLGFSQRRLNRANVELEKRAIDLGKANERLRSEIEQRERAEAELRQAQKMEAIGQLTGGVAHDFNNLLQIMMGSLDLLQRRSARWNLAMEAANDFTRYMDAAREGGRRASLLTRQLLAFSRRQPLAPTVIDVNKLIGGVSGLLHRTLGEAISVETVLAGGLWPIMADANQLEGAILNLAVNARDAMPEGGKLTIEAANSFLDEEYVSGQEGLKAGQYVLISVTDTGCGMSEETISRAFEPFYTTKPTGRGSGLGLSQVYGFCKQSGGHARIYSEPGEGTTIKLYLPRHVGARQSSEQSNRDTVPLRAEQRSIILVVEDEETVRTSTVEMLRELGHTVFDAQDGPSALKILESNGDIRLLFTDIVLPGGLNGRQIADEARKRRPKLKVLYTTGYARNAIMHDGRLDPGVSLITKPFTFAGLAAKISEVLKDD